MNYYAANSTNKTVRRIVKMCSIFAQDTRVSELYNTLSEVFDVNTPYNIHQSNPTNACAVMFINEFYFEKGFDRMAWRINDLSRPLSLDEVRDVMRPLYRCTKVLQENFRTSTAAKIANALRTRLLRVTFDDVRSEKRDATGELLKILASMLRDRHVPAARAAFRDISLHLSASLVRLPVFEKRITGMREICSWAPDSSSDADCFDNEPLECIDAALCGDSSDNINSNGSGEKVTLGTWVVRRGILEALFGRAEDVHVEVAKRAKDLLGIVAKEGLFGETAIATVLPCCCSGHESVRRAMCAAVAAAVPRALTPASLLTLDAALASTGIDFFTADYAAPLISETIAAELESPIPVVAAATATSDGSTVATTSACACSWKCLARMWALAQDDSPLPGPNALAVLEQFCAAFARASRSGLPADVRKYYQQLALSNLRDHISSYQALYFLTHAHPPVINIVPAVPPSPWRRKTQQQQQQQPVTKKDKKFDTAMDGVADPEDVVQAFLEDCVYYKTDVVAESKEEIAAADGALAPPASKVLYNMNVKERLAFMAGALQGSEKVHLTRQAAEKLWEAFVTNAITRSETEQALDFFIAASTIPANPMSKDVVHFLFPEMTITFEPNAIHHKELDFVEHFFHLMNVLEGHYVRTGNDSRLLVHNINLIGADIFWDFCLKAEDRSVGVRAVDSILSVLADLDDSLLHKINHYRENVLKRCISLLEKEEQKQQQQRENHGDTDVELLTPSSSSPSDVEMKTPPATPGEPALEAMAQPEDPLVLGSAPVVTPTNRLGVFRTLLMAYKVLAGALATRNDAHNSDTKRLVRLSINVPSAKDPAPTVLEVVVPQKTTLHQLCEKLIAENPGVMHEDYHLFLGKTQLKDLSGSLLSLGITGDTVLTAKRPITIARKTGPIPPSIPSLTSPAQPQSLPQEQTPAAPTTKCTCNNCSSDSFDLAGSVMVTPRAYSLLFKTLASPEGEGCPCSAIAAMILNMLPTCPALVRKLRAVGDPAVGEVRWPDLVSTAMGPRFLMYFIPALLAALHGKSAECDITMNNGDNGNSPNGNEEWKAEFVKKGGAVYMASLFIDCDVAAILAMGASLSDSSQLEKEEALPSNNNSGTTSATASSLAKDGGGGVAENTKCYYLVSDLLCVLEELFIAPTGKFVVVPGLDIPKFYIKIFEVCALLCTAGVRIMGSADDDSVSRCLRLIVGIATEHYPQNINKIVSASYLMNWIRSTLIYAPLKKHREIVMLSLVGTGRILPPDSEVLRRFIPALWNVLPWVASPEVASTAPSVAEYFETLTTVNKPHHLSIKKHHE